ncbi:MAG: transglutaminase family protein [Gemmataceae bacterium]
MRKCGTGIVVLLFVWHPSFAAEPKPSKVSESWDAAFLEGNRIGFFHTTTREIERDGLKVLRTTLEMDLTVKRYGSNVHLRMENGTEETTDGKVMAVSMTMYQDAGKKLVLKGTVEEDQLHVTVDSAKIDKRIPWNDKVIGLHQQEGLFKARNANPGDNITYLTYEPTLNTVITVQAKVLEHEVVDCLGIKRRLLRVEAKPDKIEVSNMAPIQLPGIVDWLDKDLKIVRSEMTLPGMGSVVLCRTDQAAAKAPINLSKLPDIGLNTLVPLNRSISDPYNTKAAVYRITLKNDDANPTTAFAKDDRQEIRNARGKSFELHITAIKKPRSLDNDKAIGPEFAESNYFLDWDNAKIRSLTREAAGEETDSWMKAKRIENWVYQNVHSNNGVPFGPASQVADKLLGDCRQHTLLAAAMCRAAGVPSRTAVGLIYLDDVKKGPAFGFHMWAEVWTYGQWVSIDPTFGPGKVGATHIKIADHSWHDTQSYTPLLGVARVIGNLKIEVVSVDGRGK